MTDKSYGPRRTFAERNPELQVLKVPADSVPFGESVSRNGRTVWAVYEAGELRCLGATAKEARHSYYGARALLDADRLIRKGECKANTPPATGRG
jgi:hypothetical protein